MLAYRHAFHAGNHADVLKHCVLLLALQYLGQKPKPYWVIDTHAGAGLYALDSAHAVRNAEYESGIGRLWPLATTDPALPAPLADYLDIVRSFNADGLMRFYPGSPAVIHSQLRNNDRLRLFELHPTDHALLSRNYGGQRAVRIERGDGFATLKALLPPPPRRGLVFIDPPYELKTDYDHVLRALDEGLKRFADGMYMIWYPLLTRREPQQMVDKLKKLPVKSWLHASLTVCEPKADGLGMLGSGMFVLNPPWTMHDTLKSLLPWLVKALGQYGGASYRLEQRAA